MQLGQAFHELPPGEVLLIDGYFRKNPGSLFHQPSEAVWSFIKHHEDRLSVVSWDDPVTVKKHGAPRGWALGQALRHLFDGVVVINLREATGSAL